MSGCQNRFNGLHERISPSGNSTRRIPPCISRKSSRSCGRRELDWANALAAFDGTTYVWFWIGTHDEYLHLIASP